MTNPHPSTTSAMVEALKPCPFCGVELTSTFLGQPTGSWRHPNIPTNCPAQHISVRWGNEEAIAAWNTRLALQSSIPVEEMRAERAASAAYNELYGDGAAQHGEKFQSRGWLNFKRAVSNAITQSGERG